MYTIEIVAMLGKRYKDYRIGSNLTQKQVSEKAGISIITIRNFENGKLRNISMGTPAGVKHGQHELLHAVRRQAGAAQASF